MVVRTRLTAEEYAWMAVLQRPGETEAEVLRRGLESLREAEMKP